MKTLKKKLILIITLLGVILLSSRISEGANIEAGHAKYSLETANEIIVRGSEIKVSLNVEYSDTLKSFGGVQGKINFDKLVLSYKSYYLSSEIFTQDLSNIGNAKNGSIKITGGIFALSDNEETKLKAGSKIEYGYIIFNVERTTLLTNTTLTLSELSAPTVDGQSASIEKSDLYLNIAEPKIEDGVENLTIKSEETLIEAKLYNKELTKEIEFNNTTLEYNLKISEGTPSLKVILEENGLVNYKSIKANGIDLEEGEITISNIIDIVTITLIDEEECELTYVFNIIKLSDDTSIKTLKILDNLENELTYEEDGNYYIVTNKINYNRAGYKLIIGSNETTKIKIHEVSLENNTKSDLISFTKTTEQELATKITLTSESGIEETYYIVVTRKSIETTYTLLDGIKIEELVSFENLYTNTINEYYKEGTEAFIVPNEISALNIEIIKNSLYEVSYKIVGDTLLEAGKENKIVIILTASDLEVTRSIFIYVYRNLISYNVNNKSYPKIEVDQTIDSNIYDISIKKNDLTKIDFTKLIEVDGQANIEVLTDITDTTTQVIIKVSNGDSYDLIKLNIKDVNVGVLKDETLNQRTVILIALGATIFLMFVGTITIRKRRR